MYTSLLGATFYWFVVVPMAMLFAITGSYKAAGWLLEGKPGVACPRLRLLTQLLFLRIPGFLVILPFDSNDAISILLTGSYAPTTENAQRSLMFAPPLA